VDLSNKADSFCAQQQPLLSVRHVGGSVKMVEARITKISLSAAWNTPVSGSIKLFYKFKNGSLQAGALNEREWEKFAILSQ